MRTAINHFDTIDYKGTFFFEIGKKMFKEQNL